MIQFALSDFCTKLNF